MTRNVFDNAMSAHVWAQQTQESGKSHNGNLYFEGRALYSYGSHFVAGYMLPGGRPLLNADSYSISTSKHQGYAARATRYNAPRVPGLTDLSRVLESAFKRAEYWARRPHDAGGQNAAETLKAGRASLAAWVAGEAFPKSKAAALNDSRLRYGGPKFPELPAQAIAWAFESLGLKEGEAERAAARALAARARNAAAWQAAVSESELRAELASAKAIASGPLSDLAARMTAETRGRYFEATRHGAEWLAEAKRFRKAAKAAKAKGWARIAAEVKARESLIRATVKRWPELQAAANGRTYAREALAAIRATRAQPGGPALSAYTLAEGLKHAGILGLIASDLAAHNVPAAYVMAEAQRVARIAGQHSPKARERWAAWAAETRAQLGRLELAEARAVYRDRLAAMKEARAAIAAGTATESALVHAAQRVRNLAGNWQPGNPFALAGWTQARLMAEAQTYQTAANAARAAKEAERERVRAAWESDCREAWHAGQPQPVRPAGVAYSHLNRLGDGQGGALLRAVDVERDDSGVITGGTLETSWGAEVPLAHAVRAFRFLKLCRDNGRPWKANGKTLPVGHFRIESIDAEGNFIAGCHAINWAEVELVARGLGLADLAGADTTESRQFA